MRLRIYSYLYRPDHAGGASIFTDLAEGLVAAGHNVTVVCTHPFYPEWSNKSGANLWRSSCEEFNGVRVIRHGLYIPSRPDSMAQRAVYEGSYFLSQMRSLARRPVPDVVIAFAPLVSSMACGVACAKLYRKPLWVMVQDISSGGAAAFQTEGRSRRALRAVERFLMRQADLLSTISPVMCETLAHLTGREDVFVLPNWLHRELADAISQETRNSDRGRARPRPRVLYAGNIGMKQGLDRLTKQLASQLGDFDLTIFGEGSGSAILDEALAMTPDPRISRGPFLPEVDFARELAASDVFLVSEVDTGEAAFLPSKLIPAAASQCPVLAICGSGSPIRVELDQHNTGRCLDWNELDRFIETIHAMTDPTARVIHAEASRRRAVELSSESAIGIVGAKLESLMTTR